MGTQPFKPNELTVENSMTQICINIALLAGRDRWMLELCSDEFLYTHVSWLARRFEATNFVVVALFVSA